MPSYRRCGIVLPTQSNRRIWNVWFQVLFGIHSVTNQRLKSSLMFTEIGKHQFFSSVWWFRSYRWRDSLKQSLKQVSVSSLLFLLVLTLPVLLNVVSVYLLPYFLCTTLFQAISKQKHQSSRYRRSAWMLQGLKNCHSKQQVTSTWWE